MPPCALQVLRLKSRAYLQSPMNDLAPPEDALRPSSDVHPEGKGRPVADMLLSSVFGFKGFGFRVQGLGRSIYYLKPLIKDIYIYIYIYIYICIYR